MGLSSAKVRLSLASQINKLCLLDNLLTSCCIPNKPNFEVWLQSGSYKLPNNLARVDGVLDHMKIRLTQPQVELVLGLILAKIQHSLKNTFF
jgi:hypothetical protein